MAKYFVQYRDETFEVEITETGAILIDGSLFDGAGYPAAGAVQLRTKGGSRLYRMDDRRGMVFLDGPKGHITMQVLTRRQYLQRRSVRDDMTSGGAEEVVSVMPGAVVRVNVREGETVSRGQSLLVLEAMKMENDVRAEIDGVVKAIRVAPGDKLESGSVMMIIRPASCKPCGL